MTNALPRQSQQQLLLIQLQGLQAVALQQQGLLPMLLVLAVGPLLRWRGDKLARVRLPIVALGVLGLPIDADRNTIRTAYTGLARQYHPDRNGGDRSLEGKLREVVEAYHLLRASPTFA